MTIIRGRRAGLLLAAALAPLGVAQAASCPASGAKSLSVGTVTSVESGGVRAYSIPLKAGEGVIVDLTSLTPAQAEENDGAATLPRSLALCDAGGTVLAPQPGEVFQKGGSLSTIEEGERLRFVAPADGDYLVAVASADAPREILVRRRDAGVAQSPVIPVALGRTTHGIVSSGAPIVYSFTGSAGQWVELRASSEKDTLLRLAAPDREGGYSVVAENDDSDGLNPVLRRKLRTAGTYYLQVDSLDDSPGDFELALQRINAPKPPPPPAALRPGAEVAARLEDSDAVALYALPVSAGHSYRLDLTAPYDGVVAIGLPNPVESDTGGEGADAGFSEVKSQDANVTGTERLNFTARSTGTLLVRVKSFGLDDTDGSYTLTATDLGG
jgi:hypothetical protein